MGAEFDELDIHEMRGPCEAVAGLALEDIARNQFQVHEGSRGQWRGGALQWKSVSMPFPKGTAKTEALDLHKIFFDGTL